MLFLLRKVSGSIGEFIGTQIKRDQANNQAATRKIWSEDSNYTYKKQVLSQEQEKLLGITEDPRKVEYAK